MRGGPSTRMGIASVASLAIFVASCTHDFGAFSVTDDAATAAGDASSSHDANAPPADGGDAASDATISCGAGVSFGGHCYFAASAPGTFDATRAACVAAGAHLATIGSPAEQAAVAPIGTGMERWIGLLRTGDAGATNPAAFTWITGEPSTFANWTAGEPNGSGPCARLRTDGTWADQTCATSLAAICERE